MKPIVTRQNLNRTRLLFFFGKLLFKIFGKVVPDPRFLTLLLFWLQTLLVKNICLKKTDLSQIDHKSWVGGAKELTGGQIASYSSRLTRLELVVFMLCVKISFSKTACPIGFSLTQPHFPKVLALPVWVQVHADCSD